jgi:hypothetical protein
VTPRIAGGLLCAGLFFAAMFWMTRAETSVECTVCIRYGGSESCATVSGPDERQARMQAASTACAPLSAGVTQGMECSRTPPSTARCTP